MGKSLEKAAADFMNSPQGSKLADNKDKLGQIANSADGQKIRSMFSAGEMRNALEQGDMEAVRAAVSRIMNTDAGARVAKSLDNLLKQ